MPPAARQHFRRASCLAVLAVAGFVSACASESPKSMVDTRPRSKEYFSETEYGVKASPRSRFTRLVGRDQVGKPYKVRGKWYYPKEYKKYVKVGLASWYGDAFHGRLTANGEVYNMTDLTAAHPTMPLPSYARVTNLANGSSVIVRVNDRGPYAGDRVIDLSQHAAQMLGYANVGTAKVKVEYVGRAPLEGGDQSYLMASYQPGNKAPDPSVGLPTGVMVAMNGSTPTTPVGFQMASAFPGQLTGSAPAAPPPQPPRAVAFNDVALPDFGPIVPERPEFELPAQSPFTVASLDYADERVSRAAVAFAAFDRMAMKPADVVQSWKSGRTDSTAAAEAYVAAGSYEDAGDAKHLVAALAAFGRIKVERSKMNGKDWYSVNLYQDGHAGIDAMLQAAWSNGAPDALVVRD